MSSNAELLISTLNVSEEYKPILKAPIAYANEFRHAAEKVQTKATAPPRGRIVHLPDRSLCAVGENVDASSGAKLVPKHHDAP